MSTTNVITQSLLHGMFHYREDGALIHRHTIRGGKRTGDVAGSRHNMGYLQIMINGKKYLLHRLVWLYHYGKFPTQLDHINGVRTDNRLENLRECTYSQNHMNKKLYSTNTSGKKGVSFVEKENVWNVYVANRYVGRRKTRQDAADLYDTVAKSQFGKFALLNKELT